MQGQERQEDPQLAAWKDKQAEEAEQKRAAQEESVNAYEAAFVRIKHMTNEPDLEKVFSLIFSFFLIFWPQKWKSCELLNGA